MRGEYAGKDVVFWQQTIPIVGECHLPWHMNCPAHIEYVCDKMVCLHTR